MKRATEKQYSIELSKLKNGLHVFDFDIDSNFFSRFEYSQVQIGEVKVTARIHKYDTHLDTRFGLEGFIQLNCDRCNEPYKHTVSSEHRVIYAYNPKMHSDHEEVVVIKENEPLLDFSGDFYDLISLEIPIRKVPEPAVHQCAPEILALISIVPDEDEDEGEEEEEDDLDEDDWDEEEEEEGDKGKEEDDFEEEDWKEEEEEEDDLDDDFDDEEEEDDDEIF